MNRQSKQRFHTSLKERKISQDNLKIHPQTSNKRKNILIVDIGLLLLKSMQRALEEYNELTILSSGSVVLELLTKNPNKYDLIITDLYMADANSRDIYQYNTNKIPEYEKSCPGELKVFIKSVNNVCIEKPYRNSELLNIIAKAN